MPTRLTVAMSAPCSGQSAARLYNHGVATCPSAIHTRAEALLRQAGQSEPDNVDGHGQLALALLSMDRLNEAETIASFLHEDREGFRDRRQLAFGAS